MTAFSRMFSTTSQRARRARARRALLRAAVWAAASPRRMLAMVARTGTVSLWCFACRCNQSVLQCLAVSWRRRRSHCSSLELSSHSINTVHTRITFLVAMALLRRSSASDKRVRMSRLVCRASGCLSLAPSLRSQQSTL